MKYLIYSSLLIFLTACGAKQNESPQQKTQKNGSEQTEPVERLNPASAPLYPAQKEARATDFKVTLLNGKTFHLSDQKG